MTSSSRDFLTCKQQRHAAVEGTRQFYLTQLGLGSISLSGRKQLFDQLSMKKVVRR